VKLLALLPLLGLTACIRPTPLDTFGEVPHFELTSQTGQPFDSKSLDGHIWVADFIYTTCTGPCPMMSRQMHRVQTSPAETPDVKLVSFSVDPAHDTPPILAEYAKHFTPDYDRWFFLTGDQARLNDVALKGFKLNSVDGSTTHSTRFVLVDSHQRIRGYYTTSEDSFMPKLVHDIRQLEREKS